LPVREITPCNRDAASQETKQETIDFPGMIAELNGLLRLKTTVIGMKMFARVSEMQAAK
jgi:hypothetical protein